VVVARFDPGVSAPIVVYVSAQPVSAARHNIAPGLGPAACVFEHSSPFEICQGSLFGTPLFGPFGTVDNRHSEVDSLVFEDVRAYNNRPSGQPVALFCEEREGCTLSSGCRESDFPAPTDDRVRRALFWGFLWA